MKYDAFISYRHCDVDMDIAKKVHAGLEGFKVPPAIQKRIKKKRIRRVFRDQEELPIGSDLDENIADALYNSEFLIVICSPRTLESQWVMREIDTFISMHGKQNILAVLVEGEPWQSFPRQLLTDNFGNPIEPLAADVRGADKRERHEKLKSELLRLAAPVLGCSYDDLRQRHREQKIRKTLGMVATIFGSLALLAAGFGVYYAMVANEMKQLADEKSQLAADKQALADEMVLLNEELEGSLDAQLVNQSSYLAATASMLFDEGNREDAVLVSLEALPSDTNDRPYLPSVEYGLSNYLYAYSCGDEIGFDRTLTHEMPVDFINGSEDGEYIVTIDSTGAVYLWRAATGERMVKIDPSLNSYGYNIVPMTAAVDDEFIYVAAADGFKKYDFSGNVIYDVDVGFTMYAGEIFLEDYLGFTKYNNQFVVFDVKNGAILADVETVADVDFGTKIDYYRAAGCVAVSHYNYLADKVGISIIDCRNGYTEKYIEIDGSEIQELEFTDDGTITAAVSMAAGFGVYASHSISINTIALDSVSGEIKWASQNDFTLNYSTSFWSILRNRTYNDGHGDVKHTVVSVGSTIITYDTDSGEVISTGGMSGNVSDMLLYTNSSLGMVIQTNGNVDYVDMANGAIYADYVITTGKAIAEVWKGNNSLVIREIEDRDVTILTYHTAPDLETLVDSVIGNGGMMSPDEDYFATYGDSSINEYNFYGVDGEYYGSYELECVDYTKGLGFTADNYFVMIDDINGVMHWYDPINDRKGKCELYQGIDYSGTIISDVYYTRNRQYAIVTGYYCYSVISLLTMEEVYCGTSDEIIYGAAVSEDGCKVYLGYIDAPFRVVDIYGDTVTELTDLNLIVSPVAKINIVVGDDSRYVAVCCKDAYVRTVDTEMQTITAELNIYSTSRCYISFLASTMSVLVHCNDEFVNIIDAGDGTIYSQIAVEVTDIKSLGYDWELDYYVVTAANGVTLLESTDFQPVAYASKAFGYVTSTHTFLIRDGKQVYSTKYKNYQELIEEAGRQFPGAELTYEEKVKYNII